MATLRTKTSQSDGLLEAIQLDTHIVKFRFVKNLLFYQFNYWVYELIIEKKVGNPCTKTFRTVSLLEPL